MDGPSGSSSGSVRWPVPPRGYAVAVQVGLGSFDPVAGMDLAEKRVPLDGRIKMDVSGSRIDFPELFM